MIHFPNEVLEKLGQWQQDHFCEPEKGGNGMNLPMRLGVKNHPLIASGLFADILASTMTKEKFEEELLSFFKQYCPERGCPLAGSSVHCDKEVLRLKHKAIYDYLSHRIIDVSTINGLVERWMPNTYSMIPRDFTGNHRATDDIENSIRLLKWYRENVMKGLS